MKRLINVLQSMSIRLKEMREMVVEHGDKIVCDTESLTIK